SDRTGIDLICIAPIGPILRRSFERLQRLTRAAWSGRSIELLLHALVKARDVDHDPLVRAATDRLLLVARIDPERERASLDGNQLGRRMDAHSDRRRREM